MTILAYNDDIFNHVRQLPAIEVARRFGVDLQRRGNRWTTTCPFHTEKTPSFGEHRSRFYCFGCGWRGDAIALVASLFNLRPIEAAGEIARAFGIPVNASRDPAARERMEAMRRERERAVEAAQEEKAVYLRMATIYRVADRAVSSIETEADLEQYGTVLRLRDVFERILGALRNRDVEERQAALAAARRWLA